MFLLYSEGDDHIRFFFAIILSLLFVSGAYVLNWLTLDGAASSVLFGIISLGLGGFLGAAVVLGFFISSSLLSKSAEDLDGYSSIHFRRNGMQVWSNGFWFAFWTICWFTTDANFFLLGAMTAISFSTSDTWGSEIGGERVKGKTWLFGPFTKVEPGVDGGISIVGTLASIAGAILIGGIFWLFNLDAAYELPIIIVVFGFLGSIIDSAIGTYFQGKNLTKKVSDFFDNKVTKFDNNLTNWVSSGVSSLLAVVVYFLIS